MMSISQLQLTVEFPKITLPSFPGKGYFSWQNDAFLEDRRKGLEGYFKKILKNEEILSRSTVITLYFTLEKLGSTAAHAEDYGQVNVTHKEGKFAPIVRVPNQHQISVNSKLFFEF